MSITQRDKSEAMKRGLRMAAKVAAVAGVLAAAGAQPAAVAGVLAAAGAQPAAASEQPVTSAAASAGAKLAGEAAPATDLARDLRIGGSKKGCGCGPCWGPPAPPDLSWLDAEAAA